jgi:hypothetical protein
MRLAMESEERDLRGNVSKISTLKCSRSETIDKAL